MADKNFTAPSGDKFVNQGFALVNGRFGTVWEHWEQTKDGLLHAGKRALPYRATRKQIIEAFDN